MRRTTLIATCSLLALSLAACGGGGEETVPTYSQAEALAKRQLAGSGCQFRTEDESSEGLEQKGLDCYLTEGGDDVYYPILPYTRDLEVDETDALFGGLTTAERYFANGAIEVDPAGGDPTAIQLDAEEFATALSEECDCGEVLTPEG
jgi:hypothetical protein